MKYNNMYIHEHSTSIVPKRVYCISSCQAEPLINEEEAANLGLTEDVFTKTTLEHGAHLFNHEFNYGNGDIKKVTDSIFKELDDCKSCIDALQTLA